MAGLAIGLGAAFFFFRNRRQPQQRTEDTLLHRPGSPSHSFYGLPLSPQTSRYRAVPSGPLSGHLMDSLGSTSSNSVVLNRLGMDSGQYQIEPFVLPDEDGSQRRQRSSLPSMVTDGPQRIPLASPSSMQSLSQVQSPTGSGHVYVVHHDGGRAPVTIYHEDGTEVVELPPRYAGDSAGGGPHPVQSEATGGGTGSTPTFLDPPRIPQRTRKNTQPTSPHR